MRRHEIARRDPTTDQFRQGNLPILGVAIIKRDVDRSSAPSAGNLCRTRLVQADKIKPFTKPIQMLDKIAARNRPRVRYGIRYPMVEEDSPRK